MNIQSIGNSPPSSVSNQTSVPRQNVLEAAALQQQAQAPEAQASQQNLNEAVKAVSSIVSSMNNSLQFSVDDSSGKTVVKVVDAGTKEVIRQIPSEEMLAIAKALDGIKGLLVRQKA